MDVHCCCCASVGGCLLLLLGRGEPWTASAAAAAKQTAANIYKVLAAAHGHVYPLTTSLCSLTMFSRAWLQRSCLSVVAAIPSV